MKITYYLNKRNLTLAERGLDFEDARKVFSEIVYEIEDNRRDYGEIRIICFGLLNNRMVVVGYVKRENSRHIFSMRKANDKEQTKFRQQLH